MIYFGAQKWPESWASEAKNFNKPLNVAQIDMFTKTDANPVDTFF